MGHPTLNSFGTNGTSPNFFQPGLPLSFKDCWHSSWDDGEEPPYRDHQYVTVDELASDFDLESAVAALAVEETLDPVGDSSDLMAEEKIGAQILEYLLERAREEAETEQRTASPGDRDTSDQLQSSCLSAPLPGKRVTNRRAEVRRSHCKAKAKQSMPYWRRQPGCRRTIRRETVSTPVFDVMMTID